MPALRCAQSRTKPTPARRVTRQPKRAAGNLNTLRRPFPEDGLYGPKKQEAIPVFVDPVLFAVIRLKNVLVSEYALVQLMRCGRIVINPKPVQKALVVFSLPCCAGLYPDASHVAFDGPEEDIRIRVRRERPDLSPRCT